MMGIAVPKYSNGRGYDNYFNNLGRAVKTVADPIISGVGQGIDMTTDMLSDFAGKYMQLRLDPNLMDGKSLPDINPKQMLMDATGFQGVDLSMFEPETTGGKAAKDIITYICSWGCKRLWSNQTRPKAIPSGRNCLRKSNSHINRVFCLRVSRIQ